MDVTLIGTMHNDLKGKERLEKLLYYTKPEVLTIEGSDEMEKFNIKLKSELSYILAEKGITSQDSVETFMEVAGVAGYEWDICKEYCKGNSIPLYKIEPPGVADYANEMAKESLNILRNLPEEKVKDQLSKFEKFKKSRFKRHFLNLIAYNESLLTFRNANINSYLVGERDNHMYEKIKEISEELQLGKKIVHVGGAQHMVQHNKFRDTLGSKFPDADVYLLSYADLL